MLLEVKDLVDRKKQELNRLRSELSFRPGLEIIWVGSDAQTQTFINAKQKMAKEYEVDFFLCRFERIDERQLEAVIQQANSNKKIHGVVVQLPLPDSIRTERMIQLIDLNKDVDSLRSTNLPAPTAQGIIEILDENKCLNENTLVTVLGLGKLVGDPLVEYLKKRKIPVLAIEQDAEKRIDEISKSQILVSCTGVTGLVNSRMVNKDMVVVDGSGVDVVRSEIEPLARLISPERGAVGKMTVINLFLNLFTLAKGS